MTSFRPRTDILPPSQLRLWPELRPTRQLGLVLYGGTAIALPLGHRPSIDFDFFTSEPLDKASLRLALPFLATSETIQDEPNTLTVLSSEGVKVSFFGCLPFGRYGSPEVTDDGVMTVASLDDLMALKIKVILQRSEAKDYLDIAAMLKAAVELSKGLAISEAMFKPELTPVIALKALTYFEGGDLGNLPKETKQILSRSVSRVTRLPSVLQLSPSLT